ncbi:hypothetical protein LCGC14_3169630, partial [marine sediment metagenome]
TLLELKLDRKEKDIDELMRLLREAGVIVLSGLTWLGGPCPIDKAEINFKERLEALERRLQVKWVPESQNTKPAHYASK